MKKDQKIPGKLAPKDYERMWGEDGPYSQVRLCEETRILDDSISRVFLVVEAEINPFTFECVKRHREHFVNDEPVIQLLDHAEYRGKFGYVVSAGEVELRGEESKRFARKQADMTIQTLIRIHTFVIEKYNLRQSGNFGVIEDEVSHDRRLIWNEGTGQVEEDDGGLWDSETLVGGPAGVRNNKMRFFIVLAFEKNFEFRKEAATVLAKTLKRIAKNFQVEIEDCESFKEYLLIAALLPFGIAPSDFIEATLDACNGMGKKPIFEKDYLVTNAKRPSPEQIAVFLRQLPLDRDIEMPL